MTDRYDTAGIAISEQAVVRHWCRAAAGLVAVVVAALLLAAPAQAALVNHPLLFSVSGFEPAPNVHESFEDPCGLALSPTTGDLYVSDYYPDQVAVFSSSGQYSTRIAREEPIDGPCGLALDPAGDLYVNNFHRNVIEFTPAEFGTPDGLTPHGPGVLIDSGHPTGLALDPATGNLYIDDRTYVAEYEPSGKLIAKIGFGTLAEGYGVAVSDFPATEGFLYVPDAATGTVKVYDPAVSTEVPKAVIAGQGTPQAGFDSLRDAAVAVDQSNGHLFVADNLQSQDYEHPRLALDEFNASGDYRGQLPEFPILTDGGPSGLAVNSSNGDVYVTGGNTEGAGLYAFGPTAPASSLEVLKTGMGEGAVTSAPAGIDCGGACAAEFNEGSEVVLTATPASGSNFVGWAVSGDPTACQGTGACHVVLGADTEVSAEFEELPAPAFLLPAPTAPPSGDATSAAPSAAAAPGNAPTAPPTAMSSQPRHLHHFRRRHRSSRRRHR